MRVLTHRTSVRGLFALLLLAPLALGGCDSLLDVDNPQIVEDSDLSDPDLVAALENGVRAQFQRSFGDLALYTSMLTDELVDGHTYRPHRPWDLRELDSGDLTPGRYAAAHRLRGTADTLATKIAKLVDDPNAHLSMAWARAYAGYSFIFLGEYFCSSPIDASAPYSSNQLLGMAVERFDDAIAIAQAARSAGMDADEADRIINLARVGAARASLQMGEGAAAVQYATAVPGDYVFWVDYADNGGELNDFYDTTVTYDPGATGVRWAGIDPAYEIDDLRIPYSAERLPIMDARRFYAPYQPSSFSGWVSGDNVAFTRDMDIRLASGLEAQYIIQEVNGPTLQFLNERRAVGGQTALVALPADAMAELRDQRRRDFYLDGHRLGDLRRYLERDGVNLFPSGTYPDPEDNWSEDMTYGTGTCIPISSDELNSNPNV